MILSKTFVIAKKTENENIEIILKCRTVLFYWKVLTISQLFENVIEQRAKYRRKRQKKWEETKRIKRNDGPYQTKYQIAKLFKLWSSSLALIKKILNIFLPPGHHHVQHTTAISSRLNDAASTSKRHLKAKSFLHRLFRKWSSHKKLGPSSKLQAAALQVLFDSSNEPSTKLIQWKKKKFKTLIRMLISSLWMSMQSGSQS